MVLFSIVLDVILDVFFLLSLCLCSQQALVMAVSIAVALGIWYQILMAVL